MFLFAYFSLWVSSSVADETFFCFQSEQDMELICVGLLFGFHQEVASRTIKKDFFH